MKSYQLSIITPAGKVFDGQIESLVASGVSGSFGILGNHTPMVISLKSGPLMIKSSGNEQYFSVSAGVLEVNQQSDVLLLADLAVSKGTYAEAKSALPETVIVQ